MWGPARAIAVTAAGAILVLGCEQPEACTAELRFPIRVLVSSPLGLEVDSVTARSSSGEGECEAWPLRAPASDASPSVEDAGYGMSTYYCAENGAGSYFVRVSSGSLSWTKLSRYFAKDGCHAKGSQTLEFVLDPQTAD